MKESATTDKDKLSLNMTKFWTKETDNNITNLESEMVVNINIPRNLLPRDPITLEEIDLCVKIESQFKAHALIRGIKSDDKIR
mgnify:CR=1 FL=1